MSENYWDHSEEEILSDEVERDGDGPSVFVNGSYLEVQVGANFKDTCKDVAKNAGLGKFRVFLNSEEVIPSECPDVIGENDEIELRKYDLAGQNTTPICFCA